MNIPGKPPKPFSKVFGLVLTEQERQRMGAGERRDMGRANEVYELYEQRWRDRR